MGQPGGVAGPRRVSAVITAARERSGSTVEELAATLAVAPGDVRGWESGSGAVSPAVLRRLNRALVFTPADVAVIEAATGILLDLAVATGSTEADHLRSTTSPAWLDAALALGCPFSGGGFQPHRIEGWIDGYRIVVTEARRGGIPATAYQVGFESLAVGLRIRRGDWASHVASRFSAHRVVTGHRRFDEMFVAKADDTGAAAGLLSAEALDALVALGARFPTVRVGDVELSCLGAFPLRRSDAGTLAAATRDIVGVAATFAEPPSHRRSASS